MRFDRNTLGGAPNRHPVYRHGTNAVHSEKGDISESWDLLSLTFQQSHKQLSTLVVDLTSGFSRACRLRGAEPLTGPVHYMGWAPTFGRVCLCRKAKATAAIPSSRLSLEHCSCSSRGAWVFCRCPLLSRQRTGSCCDFYRNPAKEEIVAEALGVSYCSRKKDI